MCVLSLSGGLFDIVECRLRKLSVPKKSTRDDLLSFQADFVALVCELVVDHVVIRERPTAGKFAGSSASFKLEAVIQLADGIDVSLLPLDVIKETLKNKPLPIAFVETGLKPFQEQAFKTAYAALCQH